MSTALEAIHLLRPQMLWGLLALPPLLWWWWRRGRHANVWRAVVDPHLLQHLLVARGRRRIWPMLVICLAVVLAILALAGPSWRRGEQALWEQRAPLVIALDLSGATNAGDLPPSRLLRARAKLASLLRDRQGGQIGLVAYADDAFTVAPITDDAANVALFLDSLAPDIMPVDGQRTDRAIGHAVRLLRQAGFDTGEVLLMTDHADSAAQTAAAQASSQGFRVSAIGLGSPTGSAFRRADGSLGRAQLDEASLRALVARGGGRYAPLSRDDGDLITVRALDPQPLADASGGDGKRTVWLDEGFWLLPPLMLLALLAFRRGAAPWLLATCALLWTLPSHAQERAWWKREDQLAHDRIEQGARAYREGDYANAEQAFRGQRSAEALYNLGNALAKQGRYDEAIASYDAALAQQPGMADAIVNRAVVERARRPPQQSGKGQGQSGQNGSTAKAGSQPDSQPKAQEKSDTSTPKFPTAPPDSPQAANGDDETPSPSSPSRRDQAAVQAADAGAQRAADAAQRERMRQVLARQRARTDGKGNAQSQVQMRETPEQRERRQALEAWLKRVPDDPGGLLKAKFQLEHERRAREGQ